MLLILSMSFCDAKSIIEERKYPTKNIEKTLGRATIRKLTQKKEDSRMCTKIKDIVN